ncbi:hypothetical protein [Sporomusa sp.]|uniref:hypothetical protein n=1 Tax=Sporomusa sp. TaxID=2078658 RepID=UPI002B970CA0|nr:hypothetical protein [Sporomusa sp.]HWR42016.1 hypothetical protein [Sporomusa sp.]
MTENRDLKASKGIPAKNQVVSEISVNNEKILSHSDIGHTEKDNSKRSDRR